MIKLIFENPPKKTPRLGDRSRCLALVVQSQDRIKQLRDMDMSWNVIASHLRISISSLRNAIKQINVIESADTFGKPKASLPNLTLYFSNEVEKKRFIECVRTIQIYTE